MAQTNERAFETYVTEILGRAGLNDEVLDLCAKNQLTVTRQVPCHPGQTPLRRRAVRRQWPDGCHVRAEEPRHRTIGWTYMADQDFQGAALPILAREIFEAVRAAGETGSAGEIK